MLLGRKLPVGPLGLRAAHGAMMSFASSLRNRAWSAVDNASLVYFRIAFGAIMLWEVGRYFAHGWIAAAYTEPAFYFPYWGFKWVQPWPGVGMYIHFGALGVLAVFIAIGLWYRVSAILFCLGFTYVFLLDQTHYLNHFYLVALISFLMIWVPADRALSIDALRKPGIRSNNAPAWTLWLLRAQIGIPYFYGGLAKLNSDWLRGEPLRTWLAHRTEFPIIGPLFTEEWMVLLLSSGGLVIDLVAVPCLLWSRTRKYAFAVLVVFHLMNARLFSIGIFPWFMIAATAMFFRPDWPRRWFSRGPREPVGDEGAAPSPSRPAQRTVFAAAAVFLALQLLIPLRHHLYPGNVSWTEEGHRFAWRMKLRSKTAVVRLFATDAVRNRTWDVDPLDYLTRRQLRKVSTRPILLLQFAHHIADELRQDGFSKIEIRARVYAQLNGREPQLLIDPTVDLAAETRTLGPTTWIMPLETPPPER